MAKRDRCSQRVFRFVRRRGAGRAAKTARATGWAVRVVAVALWATPGCNPGQNASLRIVKRLQKFANCLTGSENLEWVRRSGIKSGLLLGRGMIASTFAAHART